MKAVILAGGLGKRLLPFTQVIPKPLLPIGESSVLEIQILSLARSGFDEIYIATNYMAEVIEATLGYGDKYGVRLTFSKEDQPLGTCGPVRLLRTQLDQPFLLINGDILTLLNFKETFDEAVQRDADLTVVTKEVVTPFNFGKVTADGPYIVAVEEKPDLRIEILAGIYILKPPVLDLVPANQFFGMDDLIKEMLARQMRVGRHLMKEYWLDIGRVEEYRAAQDAYPAFSQIKKQP